MPSSKKPAFPTAGTTAVQGKRIPRKRSGKKTVKNKGGKKSVGKSVVHVGKNGNAGYVKVGRTTIGLMTGEIDVSTWTDEELLAGKPKNVRRTPHVIPTVVYNELIGRIMARVRHKFAAELEVAVQEHMKIIRDEDVPAAVRLAAIRELYDRVMGKAPDHVVLHDGGSAPWQRLTATAIVGNVDQVEDALADDIEDGEIIEGEVVNG